ncbi:ZIP Zinc transporter [Pseudozyma hubeiensis SY62]|uniref:ZIP Zinc transporter n=1 Tax=Pseudozyma hubeiensis (strain SY62) TaxID=1305764 RepID=R9PEN7_PSEHS|nr:ZIP Zinc transporter [Pseudozyma hubeiensis SY62]GAC96575.1 ZIP Zinc transporter [Pseudozyma hubeiensis SY62]
MFGLKRASVAALLLLAATPFVSAQASITTAITVSGTPTTTIVAPSPTGRGYCEFFVDHWDCDPTRAEVTTTASSPSAVPSPEGQNCVLHVDHYHCDAATTSTTAAAAAQASPTGQGECVFHVDHWDCEGGDHAGHDHSGHSHAGHSHGPSELYGCGLAPLEDYDLPLHIGAVFILLVSTALGAYLPILLYTRSSRSERSNRWADEIFFICRHFGTGVLISTAFVHLLSHAVLYFGNECVGELKYEATGPAIAMGAVWLVFLMDFFLLRALRKKSVAQPAEQQQEQMEKRESNSSLDHTDSSLTEGGGLYGGLSYAQAKVAEWDVIAIEAGIIFHSILIGVTLGVATGSGFVALLIAIVFHQLFEGLALGSRLSLLTWKSTAYKATMATAFVLITPIGVAIGIGVRKSFNSNSAATLITLGTFHALSAGILLYTALVELLSGDFIHNVKMQKNSLARCIAAVAALTIGIMAMSVLALWA